MITREQLKRLNYLTGAELQEKHNYPVFVATPMPDAWQGFKLLNSTLAIIGSHPRTRAEFDFARTDCDIWVFNEAISNNTFPRADAVFQMHEEAIWRNPANRNDPGHVKWLQSQDAVTVYMQEQFVDVPRATRYPLEEVREHFHISYFTSSVAYALALACHIGYRRIELYGVEMETNTEYQYQRDGVTLWLGVALGLGIEIDVHGSFFNAPLYGYQGEVVIDYHRFDERIAELEQPIKDAEAVYRQALARTQDVLNRYALDASADNDKLLLQAVHEQLAAGEKLGILDGARQENMKYKGKADTMKAASGEFLFSRQEFESSAKQLTDKVDDMHTNWVVLGTQLGNVHNAIKQSAKGSPKRHKAMNDYRNILQHYMNANNKKAIYKGAATENYNYLAWLDKHIRAAGGSKSEAVLLERMTNGTVVEA